MISPGKLISDTHIDAFRNFEFPCLLRELRSFEGVCNVYMRFIKSFAAIVRPLNCLSRKDTDRDWDGTAKKQTQVFQTLKEKVTSHLVLALTRACKTYMLETDASAYQLGCMSLQKQDDNT